MIVMSTIEKPKELRPAISSDVNTKEQVLNSLAIGKSSFEISEKTDYPASTIRSFHKNNKEEVKQRRRELESLIPNILEEFKFDCLTSTELSKHLYRPLEFQNDTALQNNQEITAHKNSLTKQKMRILENTGIFDSRMTLLNFNSKSITVNQHINPTIVKFIGASALQRLSEANADLVDTKEVTTNEE